MKKILNLYNPFHLGDNIFSMIAFHHIKEYIETNDIYINYFCKTSHFIEKDNQTLYYHIQIEEFKCSKNINIYDIAILYNNNNLPPLINTWIGDDNKPIHFYNSKHLPFNIFLSSVFNQLFELCNIPIKIDRFCYSDTDLMHRYNSFKDEYRNIDILIVNSLPLSGQFNLLEQYDKWVDFILKMNGKYNIATTRKVEGVKCTIDEDYTIKDIAAISTKIKVLIAVNTGVVVGLLNSHMLDNIKKAYIFDNEVSYNYKNFENKTDITEISEDELDSFISV